MYRWSLLPAQLHAQTRSQLEGAFSMGAKSQEIGQALRRVMQKAKPLIITICFLLAGAAWAQSPAKATPASNSTATAPARDNRAAMRQENEELKQTLAARETRLQLEATEREEQ